MPNIQLNWKQKGDDYELLCPLCTLVMAYITKLEGKYKGYIFQHDTIGNEIVPPQRSFVAARKIINERISEILAERSKK